MSSTRETHRLRHGQRWGLWVFDGAMYERLTVERLSADGRIVHGRTECGPCVVGAHRLLSRGVYYGGGEDE